MIMVENLDLKRVCDISDDKRIIVIRKRNCVTYIFANENGTLSVTHERISEAA